MTAPRPHLSLVAAVESPAHAHRLRRFAFREPLPLGAQQALVRLHLDLQRQLRGLVRCAAGFDPATGEWVDHSVWIAGHAPPGENVSAETSKATMRRLRHRV
ncbi:hypothetical protein NED98_22585 [Sphingomonas sp. MMSM20]|uniref:hypothetical protein n=1 Tax=Sphingomonas lycopersici TaxID=2951807 RepID=UPI002238F6DB|nr:hypothetical protein [Sphingomonas lycopersici]MCW6533042.1 hypothetical protein [Sphingomonas lycopersici]